MGENQEPVALTLRQGNDSFTDAHIATIGKDFLRDTTELSNGDVVQNDIYDNPVGTEYHTGKTRYTRKDAFNITYDITNPVSFKEAAQSYEELILFGYDKAVIALVGTKLDLEAERKVPKEAAADFASMHGISHFECSAKTGENVNKVFDAITQEVLEARRVIADKEVEGMHPLRIPAPSLSKSERQALKTELKETIAGEAKALARISGNPTEELKALAKTAEKTQTSKLSDNGLRERVESTRAELEGIKERIGKGRNASHGVG